MPTGNVEFHAFNLQHIITLIIIAGSCLLLAFKSKSERLRKWLGWSLGCLLAGYAIVFYIQQAVAHSLTWQYSLPLELCNLVLVACIISLFHPTQFLTEIAYFWGLGGVLQAAITPELGSGFPSWDFIMFFWSHGTTLMAIVFLVSDERFRLRRGSVARIMIALNAYGLVVGTLDWLMGWNYGFLCKKPSQPSLFDVLGSWPWYLLSVEVIAVVTFWLLGLPWRFSGKDVKAGQCSNG
jgi:hypothetical integral membrane protein (TIGR02206 family)